jgi:hypothetical protein
MTTDFDGHRGVLVKYGVFTLACSAALSRLDALEDTLRDQTRMTVEDIWTDLEEILFDIFDGNPSDIAEASELLLGGLWHKRRVRATVSPIVASAMDAMIAQIETNAAGWDYRGDVERWHVAGRDLARRFYSDSPHLVTSQRLGREASLAFEWRDEAKQAPFGYREDRLAAAELPQTGIITLRFSFQDHFINYLNYPFYFMHEYISHVYAVETGSQLFADGWLLCAANAFLKSFDEFAVPLPLHGRQTDAFERYLLRHLTRGIVQDGYYTAKRFRSRVECHYPGCFQTLMHDLAALSPTSDFRHSDFLHRLSHHFETNWDGLRSWLEAADFRVEALWPWL